MAVLLGWDALEREKTVMLCARLVVFTKFQPIYISLKNDRPLYKARALLLNMCTGLR